MPGKNVRWDPVEIFLTKHRNTAVILVPALGMYLYSAADMLAFAIFSLVALFCVTVIALKALHKADHYEAMYSEALEVTGWNVPEQTPLPPPYPKDAKTLKDPEEALNLLGIDIKTVDRLPHGSGESQEKARESNLHWILKQVNYAILAQGNAWAEQNRMCLLKHLRLDEESLNTPQPRPFPDQIENFVDVLMILDIDSLELTEEMQQFAIRSTREIAMKKGMEWIRKNRNMSISQLEYLNDF